MDRIEKKYFLSSEMDRIEFFSSEMDRIEKNIFFKQ
jgi:hypothetical protein